MSSSLPLSSGLAPGARRDRAPTPRFSSWLPLALIALIGTTSPLHAALTSVLGGGEGVNSAEYPYTRFDVVSAPSSAGAVALFIIIATAATLSRTGLPGRNCGGRGARPDPFRRPLSRLLSPSALLGLSGSSPPGSLPLATTYMMSESLGFERGVARSWSDAPVFMGTFTGSSCWAPGCPGSRLPLHPGAGRVYILMSSLPIELCATAALSTIARSWRSFNGRIYNLVAWRSLPSACSPSPCSSDRGRWFGVGKLSAGKLKPASSKTGQRVVGGGTARSLRPPYGCSLSDRDFFGAPRRPWGS